MHAQAFAGRFYDVIIHLLSVPQKVVPDHNILFTYYYGTVVVTIVQMTLLMHTGFHPQTDGLSENTHEIVMPYLQEFETHNQVNSDDYLQLDSDIRNSSVNCLT